MEFRLQAVGRTEGLRRGDLKGDFPSPPGMSHVLPASSFAMSFGGLAKAGTPNDGVKTVAECRLQKWPMYRNWLHYPGTGLAASTYERKIISWNSEGEPE
jgi:hypothetical protein